MSEAQQPTFQLNRLFFPKMEGFFRGTPKTDKFLQAFRAQVNINGDKNLIFIFGISFNSEEKEGGIPLAGIIVEVAADIELNLPLGDVRTLNDIPLAGNMLAVLFPFLREKINYFFANNHLPIIINPMNTMSLLADLKPNEGLNILDRRNEKLAVDGGDISKENPSIP